MAGAGAAAAAAAAAALAVLAELRNCSNLLQRLWLGNCELRAASELAMIILVVSLNQSGCTRMSRKEEQKARLDQRHYLLLSAGYRAKQSDRFHHPALLYKFTPDERISSARPKELSQSVARRAAANRDFGCVQQIAIDRQQASDQRRAEKPAKGADRCARLTWPAAVRARPLERSTPADRSARIDRSAGQAKAHLFNRLGRPGIKTNKSKFNGR